MELWSRLRYLEVGWTGLLVLVAAFVGALFLRRALPEGRRGRGRISTVFLGAAPVVHLVATGLSLVGAGSAAAALHLVNLAFVILAATGIVGMVVFDIALGRTRVPTILRDFTQTVAVGCVVVIILRSGGVDPLSVLTTSAVAAAILGLALQGIISNVFAGIVLQVDRTLSLGDVVQWGQRLGTIAQINWRSSSILTPEGDTAIVPNATLLSTEVLNLSRPSHRRKVIVNVPCHRRHSPGEVRAALLESVVGVAGISSAPPPSCTPSDFVLRPLPHVVYALVFWVDDVMQQPGIEAEVRERVWYAADRAGLEGPCARRAAADAGARARVMARVMARVPIFAPLDDAERRSLSSAARRRRFAAGERILREGDSGDSLFAVDSGRVRVSKEGVEVAVLGAGDCFGEMSLLAGEPRSATCEAIAETVCWEIPKDAVAGLFARRPALLEQISTLLAARQKETADAVAAKEGDAPAVDKAAARILSRVRAYFHMD